MAKEQCDECEGQLRPSDYQAATGRNRYRTCKLTCRERRHGRLSLRPIESWVASPPLPLAPSARNFRLHGMPPAFTRPSTSNPLMPSEFHVWHRERTPMRLETLRSSRPLPGFAPMMPVSPGYGYNPNSPARFRTTNDIFSDSSARLKLRTPVMFNSREMPAAGLAMPPFSREPPF